MRVQPLPAPPPHLPGPRNNEAASLWELNRGGRGKGQQAENIVISAMAAASLQEDAGKLQPCVLPGNSAGS